MSSVAESAFKRTELDPGSVEISREKFNLYMGLTMAYGFILTAVIVKLFGDKIYQWCLSSNNFLILSIVFLVVAIAGTIISSKSKSPVVSLMGFTMVAAAFGMLLSPTLAVTSSTAVMAAFLGTVVVTAAMLIASTLKPEWFAALGKPLFIGLIAGLVISIPIYLFFPGMAGLLDAAFVILFALYIGFDWYRSQQVPSTIDNAVDCACSLYIDILNLFIRLLSIFGRR